ncbi:MULTISPECIES: hypothetical protein [Desulfovibrio]|uniref:hypothetical protein n=1 Tax=Desulfovibrio TaxID=872 RepID=UPI00266590E3|nr:hypothetical protein [Desulfovibrio piger]
MCSGSIFGGAPSKPKVVEAPQPQVAATPPPAEEVAEAPIINEGAKRQNANEAKRKGTAALRINLNMGGVGGAGGGTSGLSIPR